MARPAVEIPDPAVVVVNPDDVVTVQSFTVWLDERQMGRPSDPSVTAAETMAQARRTGEA